MMLSWCFKLIISMFNYLSCILCIYVHCVVNVYPIAHTQDLTNLLGFVTRTFRQFTIQYTISLIASKLMEISLNSIFYPMLIWVHTINRCVSTSSANSVVGRIIALTNQPTVRELISCIDDCSWAAQTTRPRRVWPRIIVGQP